MRAPPNIGRVPARNHRSAAAAPTRNTAFTEGEAHFSVRPTSVIAQLAPHASSALPQVKPAKQTKSVITLDLWFNRLWQHWKVVNEIAFFICISVCAHKSN